MSKKPVEYTPERSLLAAVLVDSSKLPHAGDLPGRDFSDADLGMLWDALVTIASAGRPLADPALLLPELAALDVPEHVRSVKFLAPLFREGVPAHVAHYAHKIRDAADRRRLIDLACDLTARADDPAATACDVRAWIEARLASIGHDTTDRPITLHAAAVEYCHGLRETSEAGAVIATTGLSTVDTLIGGWRAGELVILAARPGCGKTAFATQVAIHNATEGRPALVASLEMRQAELAGRVITAEANIDGRLIRTGCYDRSHIQRLERSAATLDGLPVHLWAPKQRNAATVSRLRGVAKMQAARGGLGLIVVDYLQLLAPADRRIQRHEQIGQMTADLKSLGHEIGCPVLCLAQLSREAEKADEPQLSHLRESGSIEQDADVVVFLSHGTDGATLHVAKHRHGTTGNLPIEFIRRETRFANASAERLANF